MALYLGKEKIAPILKSDAASNSVKYITGTATSDEYGVITFPELDFTPTMIAVWNVVEIDQKANAEEDGEEWDDSYTQYTYNGVMLLAVYHNGQWFSQVANSNSGQSYISNASYGYYDGGAAIEFDGNVYIYNIDKGVINNNYSLGDMEFNYAIYG